MLPEEEIIYNILNPTLNSYIENPVENFSDNLVVVKNKLTAIVQRELSKSCPFILPIHKITYNENLCTCFEGSLNLKKISEFNYFPFSQYIVMMKTLQDVYNVYLNWDDFDLYGLISDSGKVKNINYDQMNSSAINLDTLKDEMQLFISLKKTPMCMINYVVYPETKNTQTLYMYGIYLLNKINKENFSNVFKEDNGSSILDTIIDGVFQEVLNRSQTFEKVIEDLILSEYPSFDDFYKSFKTKITIVPQIINSNISETYTNNLKSKVLKSLINKEKLEPSVRLSDFSEYDNNLLQKYITILSTESKSDTSLRNLEIYFQNLLDNFYKFPALKNVYKYTDFQDMKFIEFINKHKIAYNLKLFLKSLNTLNISLGVENSVIETVDRYYYTNKIIFNFLKSFYYNYICLKLYDHDKYKYITYIPSEIQSVKKYENYMSNIMPSLLNTLNPQIKLDNIQISNIIGKIFDDNFFPTYSLMQMKFAEKFVSQDLVSLLLKLIFFNKNIKYNKPLLLATIKGMSENDIDIYKQLLNIYKNTMKQETSEEDFDRGMFRVTELNKFNFFNLLVEDPRGPGPETQRSSENSSVFGSRPSSLKYLDYGGGKGDITNSIAKYLNLSKENVFVTDIKDWFGNKIVEQYKNNITYRYLKSNVLPFEDNTFDFITAFQVLHHVPNVDKALKELWRVSKNNAIILIREHDCNSNAVRALIDIEHAVFELVKDPVENPNQVPDYKYLETYSDSLKYMSKNELYSKMEFGFTFINIMYPQVKGPTRYYYSAWKVVKPDIKYISQEIKEEKEVEITEDPRSSTEDPRSSTEEIYEQEIKPLVEDPMSSEPITKLPEMELGLPEMELGLQEKIDKSVLEKELVRKESYLNILQILQSKKIMKEEDLKYMVLRYFFNKMMINKNTNTGPGTRITDSVFIEGNNEYAKIQINNDIRWFMSQRKFIDTKINIPDIIENGIKDALNKLSKVSKEDVELSIQDPGTSGSVIKYKSTIIDDIRGFIINEKDINKQKLLAAASIRYKYMGIGTCGLSIDYFNKGYNPNDNITEGFGGIFNHFFNNYCSVFEDLEKPFGSLGNFFTIDQFPTNIIHLNPPYDETLMGVMINKVKRMVKENSELTFILTLPNWPNFKEKENIRPKYYNKSFKEKIYKRDEFSFIDFNSRVVHPVDIIQIFVGNQNVDIPELKN